MYMGIASLSIGIAVGFVYSMIGSRACNDYKKNSEDAREAWLASNGKIAISFSDETHEGIQRTLQKCIATVNAQSVPILVGTAVISFIAMKCFCPSYAAVVKEL